MMPYVDTDVTIQYSFLAIQAYGLSYLAGPLGPFVFP